MPMQRPLLGSDSSLPLVRSSIPPLNMSWEELGNATVPRTPAGTQCIVKQRGSIHPAASPVFFCFGFFWSTHCFCHLFHSDTSLLFFFLPGCFCIARKLSCGIAFSPSQLYIHPLPCGRHHPSRQHLSAARFHVSAPPFCQLSPDLPSPTNSSGATFLLRDSCQSCIQAFRVSSPGALPVPPPLRAPATCRKHQFVYAQQQPTPWRQALEKRVWPFAGAATRLRSFLDISTPLAAPIEQSVQPWNPRRSRWLPRPSRHFAHWTPPS